MCTAGTTRRRSIYPPVGLASTKTYPTSHVDLQVLSHDQQAAKTVFCRSSRELYNQCALPRWLESFVAYSLLEMYGINRLLQLSLAAGLVACVNGGASMTKV